MENYYNLLNQIEGRYNPESLREISNRTLNELRDLDRDVVKYVKLAMNEVDKYYTQKTLDAGENVKMHLQSELSYDTDFRYQGSVMTRTHIVGASDIDLLTITSKFNDTDYSKALDYVNANSYTYSIETLNVRNWVNRFNRYAGDANADLRRLRLDDERILKSHYTICDISKPKSIKITNQHYHRDVDVVVASWHDSLEYIKGNGDQYRGVQIYDKDYNLRLGPDFPFLSISRINDRSSLTGGRLKKMIRFLKNVRTDSSQKIDLTSFEINAICYDISPTEYKDSYYLDLVGILWRKLYAVCSDISISDNLKSVDGTEYVFRNKPQKLEMLRKLKDEVWKIYSNLN